MARLMQWLAVLFMVCSGFLWTAWGPVEASVEQVLPESVPLGRGVCSAAASAALSCPLPLDYPFSGAHTCPLPQLVPVWENASPVGGVPGARVCVAPLGQQRRAYLLAVPTGCCAWVQPSPRCVLPSGLVE